MYFGVTKDSTLKQFDCEKGDRARMEPECDVATRTLKLRRKNLCLTMGKG